MASSFIHIHEKGFWAKDWFVEAIQLCLINEIEQDGLDTTAWIKEYKEALALQALPLIYGGMSMELEEFLIDDSRKSTIVKLLERIIQKIEKEEGYFTGIKLNRFRERAMQILSQSGQISFKDENDFRKTVNDSRWNEASQISAARDRYVHAFKLLRGLIKGELHLTASSPIDYWD